MAEFPAIEFEIRGKSNDAARNLRDFASALNKVANVSKRGDFKGLAEGLKSMREAVRGGGRTFASFSQGLSTLFDALKGAESSTATLQNLANVLGSVKGIGKISIPKGIGDGIRNIAEATAKISPESLENLDRMTAYLQRLSGIDLSGFARVWNRVGKASHGGKGNALVPQQNALATAQPPTDKELLDQLGEWMQGGSAAAAGGGLFKDVGIALQSALAYAKPALQELGELANRAGNALMGLGRRVVINIKDKALSNLKSNLDAVTGLFRSIGRIAFYRLIRAGIKAVTQALQQGIKNLYGWSKAVGGATIAGRTFAQTMDSLATSGGYFKNSIGAAVAPLISAFAPAIDFIIDKVVALINVLNQLFALLGGATSWNRATRKAQEFEDAAGGAGGAAKEALRYLAPFDELNVLPDDKKGGGGGGGGAEYEDMFEETSEFLEGLQDFVENIKTRWENQDWVGLGIYLGDKINELVDSIDFAGAGEKVGEAINAWFTTKYWTIKEINFENIGAKIAEFLNNALDNIEFAVIGRSFAQKFTILPDLIIGFIQEADWTLIGKSIGDSIRGALNEWAEWLNGKDWEEIGSDIVVAIGNAIAGLDPSSVATSIKNFLTAAWKAGVGLLTGVVKALFTGGTIETSGDMDVSIDIKGLTLADGTGQSVDGWRKALRDALPLLIGAIGFKVGGFAGAAFGAAIGIGISNSIKGMEMSDGTGNSVSAWREMLKGALPGLASAIGFKVGGIKGAIFGATIGLGIKGTLDIIQFFDGGADSGDSTQLANAILNVLPAMAGVLGFFVGGPGGALIGATIGIGLKFVLQGIEWPENGPSGNDGGGTFLGGWKPPAVEVPVTVNPDTVNEQIQNALTGGAGSGQKWTMELMGKVVGIEQPSEKPTINSTANWNDWKVYGSKTASNVSAFTTWKSTANWNDYQVYGNKSASNIARFTTWSSTANFNRKTIDTSKITMDGTNIKMNVTANVTKFTGKATIDVSVNQTQALGGVFSGGQWHNIQQFASGGLARGSQLFWAREAGPELVGTLGGHTAVMNNDQIVASVSDGVARAIASIKFHMTGMPMIQPVRDDERADEEMMYRAIVRALSDSDLGGDIELDGEKLYRAVVRRNRQNTRATGVNALATA